MEITAKIQKEIVEVVGIQCDGCGLKHNAKQRPNTWHHFSIGFYDRDGSSFQFFDVCSVDCYKKVLSENPSEENDNMSLEFVKELIKRIQ